MSKKQSGARKKQSGANPKQSGTNPKKSVAIPEQAAAIPEQAAAVTNKLPANHKQRGASKKIWILGVFAVFIAIAMSFVSWLIYAVFEENYREIKQQYYAVVSRQIVDDIENSVKNGKQIERFYGMDNVLSDMLELISTDTVPIQTAITDNSGNILYSSFATSEKKNEYYVLISDQHIQDNINFGNDESSFRIVESQEYEFMIQPLYGTDSSQIGSLLLFYKTAAIETELLPQKQSSNIATMLCISATVLILLIYFLKIETLKIKSVTIDFYEKLCFLKTFVTKI